ncbi:serine/threonine phosphatase-like protein [Euroglyphus maynei]|uniref:Serine/threonine phosphatase-like protein n=1 Tax=Euroglyphus maynei TaxID=6958 RepID=A0A1Y3BG52_EURMA|nr:serine/threonine phosphatase-like protein [Euroglyphus maynei]
MPDDDNTTERLGGGGGGSIDDVEYLDVNAILAICDCARKLIKYESKLIKRSGSTVIIGDIRGDFDTLLTMEQLLWPTVPVIAQNLVFLGNNNNNDGKQSNHDYSIETIIYLFAVKYLCPNKVILLKGVNETRSCNEKTLLIECRNRYGDERGGRIWRAINQVFDELPLVCIINESILCASSGIPKDSLKHKLSTYFDSYVLDTKSSSMGSSFANAKEFALFQHILVNIPEHQLGKDFDTKTSTTTNLFKPNPSVPNGFFFSREAFLQFMSLNNFSYMIRSNEEPSNMMDGYHLSIDNRLISIISNVNIDDTTGQRNEAIVAFVHHPDGRIQLKQIKSNYQKHHRSTTTTSPTSKSSNIRQQLSPNVFFNKN